MKNINLIKHFRKVKNIKKRRLAFKKSKKRALEFLNNKNYRDFIVKVKSKQRSDDEILEILELSYLKI
ncbi:hypothetical protein [Helicobacter pylori]|uniref:hypothetical protein n=1 Tax=Helicobacter pylori TaxID=210 RepID=UPI000EB25FBD|nr:hypothetical protein [Helicobacter pylori]RKV44251.1 hypothetical protein DD767_08140 [Helicobacter pylori]